jgi:hypothetical protein
VIAVTTRSKIKMKILTSNILVDNLAQVMGDDLLMDTGHELVDFSCQQGPNFAIVGLVLAILDLVIVRIILSRQILEHRCHCCCCNAWVCFDALVRALPGHSRRMTQVSLHLAQ